MSRIFSFLAVVAVVGAAGLAAAPQASAQDRLAQARDACASAGLNPSEAPFAYCVQSATQVYAQAAPDMNRLRAQKVCAGMGLGAAADSYAACVANVDQTLFDEQNFMAR